MIKDKLTINDDKTDFVLVGTKQHLDKVYIHAVSIGKSVVMASSVVRNLGCHISMNRTSTGFAKQHFIIHAVG